MKKVKNFAVVAVMTALCAILVSCGESYDSERLVPSPAPTTDTNTKPNTPTDDTTKVDPYAWANIMAYELNVDEDRQVESKIIAQRNNGGKDSTILRYVLGFELSAPDTVILPKPGTEMTAYCGTLSFPGKDYQSTRWENCDSAIVVTTTKGYKTNYYNVTWKTSHIEGWILFKGQWKNFKNSEETTTFSAPSLYKDAYEVVRNDSVYLREEVKHEVRMTFKNRSFSFEKKVVVDHFLKVKEGEKEEPTPAPTKVEADVWVDGLGRMVSLTRGIREDNRNPCDFALFEGSTGYTIIIDTYSTEGKYLSTGTEFHSFDECTKSSDYDGVAYIKGHFYPGAITYDYKKSDEGSHDWVVTCYINGKVEQQRISGQDAVMRGIKNFKEGNSAYPWPYLTNASTSEKVNGKMVWHVKGARSTGDPIKEHTVADSSLK